MLMPPSLEECSAGLRGRRWPGTPGTKCMNAIFWQTRDPYPRDDWHEFLNTVGVDEEIIGTPHCSSPRDTDELDAQNGGVTRRSA